MAEGYAKATGKTGVVLVTSGPGATNTVTGITDAFMDSIPLVVFTGQVPRSFLGLDSFQEADVIGVTRPITKWNKLVRSPQELLEAIPKAFEIAVSGRPGPVLIDIPKDVALEEMDFFGFPQQERKLKKPQVSFNHQMENFRSIKIEDSLKHSLSKLNFIKPTPIQGMAIPVALDGKDILGLFQESYSPIGLHVDAGFDHNSLIYKQVLIPLTSFGSTVIFKNKFYYRIRKNA